MAMPERLKTRALKRPSLWDRLVGREPARNGFLKLNNLMAQRRTSVPTRQSVSDLIDAYGIHIYKKKNRATLLRLYAYYANDTWIGTATDEQKILRLRDMKKCLGISDKEYHFVMQKVASDVLRGREEAREEEKKKALMHWPARIPLPERYSLTLVRESASERMRRLLAQDEANVVLQDPEKQEWEALRDNLHIERKEPADLMTLHKYRLYWCIENGRMPVLEPPKNFSAFRQYERAHMRVAAKWVEHKRMVKRVHYGGLSLENKIYQGTYWRCDELQTRAFPEDIWATLDQGELYLTNRQFLFLGEKQVRTLPFTGLAQYTAYPNGVEVQRTSRESVFFQFEPFSDLLVMLLGRLYGQA